MKRSKIISFFIAIVCICLSPLTNYAHEMRPAYLQIKQTSENEYELRWKIPRIGEKVISLSPQFPDWFDDVQPAL